jgi:PAS domain S-box-containing protein
MFITGTILLWTLGFIVFLINYKDRKYQWAGIMAFFSGFGPLTTFIGETMTPYVLINNILESSTIYIIKSISSGMLHYVAPYTMLMYSLEYNKLISEKKRYLIYFLFLIPTIFCFIHYPLIPSEQKDPSTKILYFRQISLWIVPYMLTCIILLIRSFIKEKNVLLKKQHLINILVVVPFVAFSLATNIISRAFGFEGVWRAFLIILPLHFVLFIILALKWGVMGVRIKLEKHDYTISNIFDNISDMVIILDKNLYIIEVNKSFEKRFNKFYKKEHCYSFFKKSQLKKIRKTLYKNLKKHTDFKKEFKIHENNKLIYYDIEIKPVVYKKQSLGFSILIKDITTYKENINLMAHLVEKEKYSTFIHLISGIAHNLKTPLMSSLGGIEILSKTTEDINNIFKRYPEDKIKDELNKNLNKKFKWEKIIKENIENVSESINYIQNQSIFSELYYNIDAIFKKVHLFTNFELNKNNCLLKENIQIDNNLEFESSIIQVLNNLIVNAIQSYKKNTKILNSIEINVYKKENNTILFEVKDFGNEIPDKIKPIIFNSMITTKGNEGSGLGLYISQMIIKAKHNGRIWFESNNKSTSFFIEIEKYKDSYEV